jgi:hypothetical protein
LIEYIYGSLYLQETFAIYSHAEISVWWVDIVYWNPRFSSRRSNSLPVYILEMVTESLVKLS